MVSSNHEDFLLNLEEFIKEFNSGEEAGTSAEFEKRKLFFLSKLQKLQNNGFVWNNFQMKALRYLREHYSLYSPPNLWKFNHRLIQ
mmetsp:Transcript_20649/g.31500  ORF Transcript_20649/g.31500 Transcript_20649/m.31500 type:complete len:86 (-) Transcript_20649:1092-1349(-)